MADPTSHSKPIQYKAIITHSGDEKYIVAKVKNRKDNTIYLAIVSYPLKYHSLIARQFESELGSNEIVQVMGGGILNINKAENEIKTYGQSGGYGPPEKEIVRKILENAAETKDFQIQVDVTDYVRD